MLSTEVKLCFYITGIYSVFIYWGYLQEKLTSQNYVVDISSTGELITMRWKFACALNMCMAIACFMVALLFELLSEGISSQRKKPSPLVFWKAAVSSALASPIGYEALQYINYPMMVLTKSSKPVPVMFIGTVFYNRRYPWYKYVSILMLVTGISMFTAFKSSAKVIATDASQDSDTTTTMTLLFGVFLVLVNLSLDGYTNNEQDDIFKRYEATSLDMMKYVNMWQGLYLFTYLVGMWVMSGQSPSSEISSAYAMGMSSPEVLR
jgi:UDP-galactose transporter B1